MQIDRVLKIQMAGAAVAVVSGVLLGGVMQPHLGETREGPAGPQILADGGGERGETFETGVALASYHGKLPDYVMGTDWKRSMDWPAERAAVSPPREAVSDEAPAPPEAPAALTRATYAYEDRVPVRGGYPSLGSARSVQDVAVDDETLPSEPDAER